MRGFLRFLVLALIALSLVGIVVGLTVDETGPLEKAVLAALAALLLWTAAQVRRRLV